MEQQQSKINRLIRENESVRNKIKKLQVKKTSDTKQTKMSSFVTTQQSTGLDSDSDVQEVRIKKTGFNSTENSSRQQFRLRRHPFSTSKPEEEETMCTHRVNQHYRATRRKT